MASFFLPGSRYLLPLCMVISMIVATGGCSEPQDPLLRHEIRIGLIVPKTSPLRMNAQSAIQGAQLAMKKANYNDGLMLSGRQVLIKLFIEDDANDPELAVKAAQKLIRQDGVIALIGPTTSRSALRVARVAEEMHIPMISPNATHPQITRGARYVFRACFTDSVQGKVLARFARETLQAESAAVLFNASNDYNRCISSVFNRFFETDGGEISAMESYSNKQDLNFEFNLNTINYNEPDVLALPNYPNEVNAQVSQARAMGLKAVLLGSDSWNPWTLARNEPFDDTYLTQHWHPSLASEESASFVEAFEAIYGETPSNIAALT